MIDYAPVEGLSTIRNDWLWILEKRTTLPTMLVSQCHLCLVERALPFKRSKQSRQGSGEVQGQESQETLTREANRQRTWERSKTKVTKTIWEQGRFEYAGTGHRWNQWDNWNKIGHWQAGSTGPSLRWEERMERGGRTDGERVEVCEWQDAFSSSVWFPILS